LTLLTQDKIKWLHFIFDSPFMFDGYFVDYTVSTVAPVTIIRVLVE